MTEDELIGAFGAWTLQRSKPLSPLPERERGKKSGIVFEPSDHALGRGPWGLSTKIHFVCDGNGLPLQFFLTGGQRQESPYARLVMYLALQRFDLRPRYVAADRGYDAAYNHLWLKRKRIKDAIGWVSNRDFPERPEHFPKRIYKRRNIVERSIGRLKEQRALSTRYDKLAINYAGELWLEFIRQYLAILAR